MKRTTWCTFTYTQNGEQKTRRCDTEKAVDEFAKEIEALGDDSGIDNMECTLSFEYLHDDKGDDA